MKNKVRREVKAKSFGDSSRNAKEGLSTEVISRLTKLTDKEVNELRQKIQSKKKK